MTNSSNILVFGGLDANDGVHTDLLGMRIGVPDREAEEFGGPGVDIAVLGAVDSSAHVESWFRIGFRRTSVDTVTAAVDALRAELRDLSPITVGLEGSVYTGLLKPTVAGCVDLPVSSSLVQRYTAIVEVVIRREPWVYAPTETLHSAVGFDLPAVASLAAQTGQHPAPLDFLADSGALELAALYAGRYPDATVTIDAFVRRAVALSWNDGAASADAAGYPDGGARAIATSSVANPTVITTAAPHGQGTSGTKPVTISGHTGSTPAINGSHTATLTGASTFTIPVNVTTGGTGGTAYFPTLWGTSSATGFYADIDVTDMAPGSYSVFCRGKTSNASYAVYARQHYGKWVRLTGAALGLYHLGVVTLPTAAVRGAQTSKLRVYLKGDGTRLAYANTFVLIPASFDGCVGWRRASGHAHQLLFEDGMVYADDAAALGEAFGDAQVLGLGGSLVAIAEQVAPAPKTTVSLTVIDRPRWDQLPGAGDVGYGPTLD